LIEESNELKLQLEERTKEDDVKTFIEKTKQSQDSPNIKQKTELIKESEGLFNCNLKLFNNTFMTIPMRKDGYINATLLYGHIEKAEHRIDHMERLRQLQDETKGFNTFIPLKFRNKDNDMHDVPESTMANDLKMYAISRLYLDNFPHVKAYWPMLGREIAQLTLSYGVNDIDGTIDDTTKIYSMAGSEEQNPVMTTEELVRLIKQVHRKPVERGTLYNVIQDYSLVEMD
jgi:2-iminoacetate synthase ThiH